LVWAILIERLKYRYDVLLGSLNSLTLHLCGDAMRLSLEPQKTWTLHGLSESAGARLGGLASIKKAANLGGLFHPSGLFTKSRHIIP